MVKSMLKKMSRSRAIAIWLFAVACIAAAAIAGGATAVPSTWVLLFLIALTPPILSFIVWRGAPPPTVAEVLRSVQEGR